MAVLTASDPITATCPVRPWSAVDADVEARVEREARQPMNWRDSLMRWLIEFNKY